MEFTHSHSEKSHVKVLLVITVGGSDCVCVLPRNATHRLWSLVSTAVLVRAEKSVSVIIIHVQNFSEACV